MSNLGMSIAVLLLAETATQGQTTRVDCEVRAVQITAGASHACALLTGGSIRCWGANQRGQLGDGTRTFRTAPVPVKGLADAVAVSAGDRHTCALKRDGTVWCWGENDFGQMGRPPTKLSPRTLDVSASPVLVAGPRDPSPPVRCMSSR